MTPSPPAGATQVARWLTGRAAALGAGRPSHAAPGSGPDARADAADPGPGTAPTLRRLDSGALLVTVGPVVGKLHPPGTDAASLRARLQVAADPALGGALLAPLTTEPEQVPDDVAPPAPAGPLLATFWPRVEVLAPGTPTAPWRQAAQALALLHRATRTSPPPGDPRRAELPPHGAPDRLRRALARIAADPTAAADVVRRAGAQVLREPVPEPDGTLVHGDWHLGQLARAGDRWLLLDVDDLGVGDPAWDLARPAGFHAAGLLDDDSWAAFLDGYRAAGGPAVPADGDPWPRLDRPARAMVVIAAARAIRDRDVTGWDEQAEALVAACGRMPGHRMPGTRRRP